MVDFGVKDSLVESLRLWLIVNKYFMITNWTFF